MTNGNAYYISDNGRITPRNRLAYKSGHTDGYNNINYQSSGNHGGAIPKNFRDQVNQQDRYDNHQHIWNENSHPNTIYRQNRQPENRPQDFCHRHQDNGLGLQDIRCGHEYHDYQDIRKVSHGIYSKNILTNSLIYKITRSNNADYTKKQMILKIYIFVNNHLYKKHDSRVQIYMCSINVCGLNSKLKYGILQDHIKKMIYRLSPCIIRSYFPPISPLKGGCVLYTET